MQDISRDTIKLASEGNIEAFENIYKKTSIFVYNVAFRIAGRREDAEEITQDVFVKIHNNLTGYRFESSLKTWIYRITVNTALNHIKKNKKENEGKLSYDDAIYNENLQKPAQIGENQEDQKLVIDTLLKNLNPDQRTCVILRNIEGLSYQEIAESLKININTVRSRLKRAREILIKCRKEVMVT